MKKHGKKYIALPASLPSELNDTCLWCVMSYKLYLKRFEFWPHFNNEMVKLSSYCAFYHLVCQWTAAMLKLVSADCHCWVEVPAIVECFYTLMAHSWSVLSSVSCWFLDIWYSVYICVCVCVCQLDFSQMWAILTVIVVQLGSCC